MAELKTRPEDLPVEFAVSDVTGLMCYGIVCTSHRRLQIITKVLERIRVYIMAVSYTVQGSIIGVTAYYKWFFYNVSRDLLHLPRQNTYYFIYRIPSRPGRSLQLSLDS